MSENVLTFPEFMRGLCNAPHDTEVCATCGGCGYKPAMCCSGISGGIVDCGCRGMPTDFEPCNQGCPQASDEMIKEWAYKYGNDLPYHPITD